MIIKGKMSSESYARKQYLEHEMDMHRREEEMVRKQHLAGKCTCSETPCGCIKKSKYDYDHRVNTCACGTCYAARLASGK